MKKLILSIFILHVCSQLQAYPITPRPLRKLVIESDCIIQAFVLELGQEKIKPEKKKKSVVYEMTQSYALLLVREVWQGKVNSDTIKIYYPAGMICPAPPRFEEHTEIIAFLDKVNEGYAVHALSYGVMTFFKKEGIQIYKSRIAEMQKIIPQKDSKEKSSSIIEWLVSCAENPHTRWEGVYELSPRSDFMSYYDRDDESAKGIFLSDQQRKRLFDALVSTEDADYNELGLVDLCKGVDDSLLLKFLKKSLKKISEDDLWIASDYMERVVFFYNNNELTKIYTEFEKYSNYNKDEKEKKKQLLKEFIERMEVIEPTPTLHSSGDHNT